MTLDRGTARRPQRRGRKSVALAGGRYVIVVMSYEADPAEAIDAEAEISRMVYEAYGA